MEDHPGRLDTKPHMTRFIHIKYQKEGPLLPVDSFALLYNTKGLGNPDTQD